MGRPRKATNQLKRTGQYRADRHGDRCDDRAAMGKPRRPAWLTGEAAIAWRLITGGLSPGVLARTDTPLLAGACRWWALWRQFDGELETGEGNVYKLTMQAAVAWKNFSAAAAKLGLSPVDRANLRVPTPKVGKPEGKARFFKVVG